MKRLKGFLMFSGVIGVLLLITLLIPRLAAAIFSDDVLQNATFAYVLDKIRIIVILFWIIGVTYNWLWNRDSFKKKRFKLRFYLSLILIFVLLNEGLFVFRMHLNIYNYATGNARGWEGTVHEWDDLLSYVPIPNATGEHIFPVGPNIPMRYDENGFRVTADPGLESSEISPSILFLGCSFTYGDACAAKETFPHLVGKKLKAKTMNAGVCSHGLAQMMVRGEKLIEGFKPDVVVVQYSPWLVGRASRNYSAAFFGTLPTPYFIKENETLTLQPPLFKSKLSEIDYTIYRKEGKSTGNFFSVAFKITFPLYFYDLWHRSKVWFGQLFGTIPKPHDDSTELENFVYQKLVDACSKNGSQMLILNLGSIKYTGRSHDLDVANNVIFVEADSMLIEKLADRNYKEEYGHWRKSNGGLILVDVHPNPSAHKIIADELCTSLGKILPDSANVITQTVEEETQ